MDNALIPFFEVFSDYAPSVPDRGALARALVSGVSVDREGSRLEVGLTLREPLGEAALRALSAELAANYGVRTVNIKPHLEGKDLDRNAFLEIAAGLAASHPGPAAVLNKMEISVRGSVVEVSLKGYSADFFRAWLRDAERAICERYGRGYRIEFAGEHAEDSAEASEKRREKALREEIRRQAPAKKEPSRQKNPGAAAAASGAIMGKISDAAFTPMDELELEMGSAAVRGEVFSVSHRDLKGGSRILCFDMTDRRGSVRVTKFLKGEKEKLIPDAVREGMVLAVQGSLILSRFEQDMVLEPSAIWELEARTREDGAAEKRVELHLHTCMSAMDSVCDTKKAVERAARWGHRAVAITDHGVCQAFPDAMAAAKKHGIKVIYGCEAYYVNDIEAARAVSGDKRTPLDGEFAVFDIETTGLYPARDAITEIGAVIVKNGEITGEFQTFVNPGRRIPFEIVKLTGISDDMVSGAPDIAEALRAFLAFVGERPLVAHNADFDTGFISLACRRLGIPFGHTYIDTLKLSRVLLPTLSRHKLNIVAKELGLPEFNHHRATDDAKTTALMLIRLFLMLREKTSARDIAEINAALMRLSEARSGRQHSYHIILLAKNETGLRNLYELVSRAHMEHFNRNPVIPRSLLQRYREGLIVGSACENSELFRAVIARRPEEELLKLAEFYDYLEIQPISNNRFMIASGQASGEEDLRSFNKKIIELGKKLKKPVAATCDVHFLDPEDEVYRRILQAGKGFSDADNQAELYFRTTDEMLEEFSYLGEENAFEAVVTAPNMIADMCEAVKPIREGTYSPEIEGSSEELRDMCERRARELYGETLPAEVRERLDAEMDSITKHHFDVIYIIAQKLVSHSLEAGYLVGSRGSVGSSLVAFLAGITEVNALPPHYRCPKCVYSQFPAETGVECGADMPDMDCPRCGGRLSKDGYDIPFATFLGFDGDKKPDIDLNFSGDYQARAHRQTVELFGEGHVFRAGTIGTVAEKTAFGFVKKYNEERGIKVSKAEENRLVKGCIGVKRTTGQHPGGLIVVPKRNSIYEFCPVQHPADDQSSDTITTHFDYHSIEENLLKLDLLGHDDPTMIKMLSDLTGVDARGVPLDDGDTMSLFTSAKALGIDGDPVLGRTGACAIPEFGTKFVREMLVSTMPTTFSELVRISGLSHGTDVWIGNAKDLIAAKTATLKEVVCTRDDIMLFLISKGLDRKEAFLIMESVRKGRGLRPEWEESMRACGVPAWYIDSCNKIKYMFPKAHAVAYVIMAFRIAWYKAHFPREFYCAYFTIRATGVDASLMFQGVEPVLARMREIDQKLDATAAERDSLTALEVCYEFYKRGYSFAPIDIYESEATEYKLTQDGLRPPFTSVPGLGEIAAREITLQRKNGPFISVEDFSLRCPKVSKTITELFSQLGVFGAMPETSQLTLF